LRRFGNSYLESVPASGFGATTDIRQTYGEGNLIATYFSVQPQRALPGYSSERQVHRQERTLYVKRNTLGQKLAAYRPGNGNQDPESLKAWGSLRHCKIIQQGRLVPTITIKTLTTYCSVMNIDIKHGGAALNDVVRITYKTVVAAM